MVWPLSNRPSCHFVALDLYRFVAATAVVQNCIVDDELWNTRKARQVAIKSKRGEDDRQQPSGLRDRWRPKYIFQV